MKVLMISSDANILREGSDAHKRYLLQKSEVSELVVLVRQAGEFKLFAALRMMREGNKGSFDIISAQDPFFLGLVAWCISQATGACLQLQLHTDLFAMGRIRRTLALFLLHRAHSVRVVSQALKQALLPLNLAAKVTVLPIFIDIAAVHAAPSVDLRAQYPQFTKLLLVASRLEPEKNVAAVVELMPTIIEAVPGVGLIIAGSGSQKQVLEQLAQKLSLKERVIFLGFRKDIYSLYKSVDAVIAPSHFEGYGASVVEALAAGTPVISTDVGVAKEAGAIVAPLNEFTHNIIAVLQNKPKSELLLPILSAHEWAQSWKNSL